MTLAGNSGKTYPEEEHNYIINYQTSLPWQCWLTQALTETVSIALFYSRVMAALVLCFCLFICITYAWLCVYNNLLKNGNYEVAFIENLFEQQKE